MQLGLAKWNYGQANKSRLFELHYSSQVQNANEMCIAGEDF